MKTGVGSYELDESRYQAYVLRWDGPLSEYIAAQLKPTDCYRSLTLRRDGTEGRRSRAACIASLARELRRTYGITLDNPQKSYSETPGFLSRTEIRYRLSEETVELWEFGGEYEYKLRGGVVSIVRARTFTDRALIAASHARAAERGHWIQTRDAEGRIKR